MNEPNEGPGRVVDARPGAPRPEPVIETVHPEDVEPEVPVTEPAADVDVAAGAEPEPVAEDESLEEIEEEVEEAAEVVESDLATLAAERDDYLDQLRRLQADFENYRKRVAKQQAETVERAAEALVEELLPVLDACDAAAQHGDVAAEPIAKALVDTLEKRGLERVAEAGDPFDPNRHEAVAHEPGDGEAVIAEVLRLGYVWKGRVLRPAMVKVRG